MKYKIIKPTTEKPMPKSGAHFGNFMPLKDMEIGDHFVCSLADIPRVKKGIESYGLKNGAAFFLSQEAHQATCWRVS